MRDSSPRPKKSLGQHFLRDAAAARRIAALVPEGARVLEIGPGPGALTNHLRARAGLLVVVEKDDHWAAHWRAQADDGLVAVHGDALACVAELVARHGIGWVAGNLPYNISGPLVARLASLGLAGVVAMVQQEVAERIVAAPGARAFSRLSALVRHHYRPELVLRLGPGAFRPPPKVRSAVVLLRAAEPLPAPFDAYAGAVRAGFAHPRKTLRNNLKGLLDEEGLRRLGIDPGLRPQAVPPGDWARIAQAISASRESSSPARSRA